MVIPFYISILSSPIFTITSLNGFFSALLTFILVPSDSDVPAFIPIANTLNLL